VTAIWTSCPFNSGRTATQHADRRSPLQGEIAANSKNCLQL
jgi:hypothetical protein